MLESLSVQHAQNIPKSCPFERELNEPWMKDYHYAYRHLSIEHMVIIAMKLQQFNSNYIDFSYLYELLVYKIKDITCNKVL